MNSASEAIRTIKPNYFIKELSILMKNKINQKKLLKKNWQKMVNGIYSRGDFSSSKIINDTNMILMKNKDLS